MTIRTPDAVVASLTADTSPYLSCDECFERVDQYVDALLLDPQHADPAMHAHLRGCAACREEAEALLELVAADAVR
ncbi:MAG TPA: hypothetical protein VFV89_09405 [Nocardioides sp.]|uniref:hypothetical protein n=1 Tax=Nocardioides sp. TaxID=35761 RepID=UPI002E33FB4B|nr:hypothetical protein [Nocardioides sp.]HEX5088015.1 hypothetical protein [Nocardioides sp.]